MAAVLIERCDFDEFLAEKFKRKCEKASPNLTSLHIESDLRASWVTESVQVDWHEVTPSICFKCELR